MPRESNDDSVFSIRSMDLRVLKESTDEIFNGAEVVMFVNAGGEASFEADSTTRFMADNFFQGGYAFQTDEPIAESGDYAFIYQSARLGDFFYRFDNFPPGEYYVDLHFIEIINTYGPKGRRVFNVFIQDEKILSDFDIFARVGSNKPLQLIVLRVSVKEDGLIVIRFEGVNGSPVVSGICIRRAPKLSDQTLDKDAENLRNVASNYERDKKLWAVEANDLKEKIKILNVTFLPLHK